MSHHPAAEIVAIALRKIQKAGNNKKYQALLDRCQAFLDSLHLIFPGPDGKLPSQQAATAAAEVAASAAAPAANGGTPDGAPDATAAPVGAQTDSGGSKSAMAAADSAGNSGAVEQLEMGGEEPGAPPPQPDTPTATEVKAHFADEDLAEARQASTSAASPGVAAADVAALPLLPDLVPRTDSCLPDSVALQVGVAG
jgi:hypothetical protein